MGMRFFQKFNTSETVEQAAPVFPIVPFKNWRAEVINLSAGEVLSEILQLSLDGYFCLATTPSKGEQVFLNHQVVYGASQHLRRWGRWKILDIRGRKLTIQSMNIPSLRDEKVVIEIQK